MRSPINRYSQPVSSLIAVACCALAGAATQTAPAAQPPPDALTKAVAYGDLDLDSADGAQALYARLRYAARQVCSPLDGRDLGSKRLWRTCVDGALASAVAQVNKPQVTALHRQAVSRQSNGNS